MRRNRAIIVVFLALLVYSFPASGQPLVEEAKKEKKVMLYGTPPITMMTTFLNAFRNKFPFIEVDYYRAGAEALAQKILTEVRGGRHLADAYYINGSQVMMLDQQGLLERYESPQRAFIRGIYKDKRGHWAGIYANLEVIGYNKSQVAPRDLPRTYEDLLHPKWKGKMGLDQGDIEWYITVLHLMGEERGRRFMREFANQDVQIRKGHTLLGHLLAAGEFSLLPTLRTFTADELMAKGAPIDWVAIQPVIPNPPMSIALPKSAPHPHASRLFIDYILSREGQEVLVALGRTTSRIDVAPKSERVRNLKIGEIDWPLYFKSYRRYEDDFGETFLKRK
ncbi:MAG: extracellular solute-binding protein [Deltaproteobacteria bacterium]|nr:extracellular solute-binding protein [Deltaproteobacteria bacterium]